MVPTGEEPILNADADDQVLLLEVQRLDTELDRVAHRRASIPQVQQVQELQTSQRVLADRITAVEIEISDLTVEQRKADNDVELVRARAAKDSELLDSGSITDPKQLTSLQAEIASLARRQAELEDVEIEVMERIEEAEHRLADLRVEHGSVGEKLEIAIRERDEQMSELATIEADLTAERTGVAARVPADLLGLYEKLRGDHGGIGAARLYRGSCEGCRIELTPVDISRIRQAPDDEVIRCEECRRILVRTAESGL